jgi:hypothetical protein
MPEFLMVGSAGRSQLDDHDGTDVVARIHHTRERQ